jgi:FAD-linked sulfhydryl oxidase
MLFDPTVWGPHYWFFLHTVARSYPVTPNDITKRKYYDLIQNVPLFIPNEELGNKFSRLLDKYPVTPYLDNRDSFIRWVHFIHNKVNVFLGKEEISLQMANDKYNAEYRPRVIKITERINIKTHYIYIALILLCFVLIYMNYK